MRYLIVNGDDFGASRGINRGILEAHQRGILTSTSLLVDAPGSEEAARLGRAARELSVGLHVDLPNKRGDCRAELSRQLARFAELMGRAPTHLTGAAVFPRPGAAARFASARTLACRLLLEILRAAGRRKALGADQRGEFGSHVEDDNRRRPHGTELSPWIRRPRLLHGL